jgi:hypothetical protein
MSEIGEYFKDLKDFQAEERRDRTARRIPELQEFGAQSLNGGAHWKLRHLSFWPSSGKWHNEKTGKRGRLQDDQPLAKLVKDQFPNEEIQIRATVSGSDPGRTQAESDVPRVDNPADDVSALYETRDMRGVWPEIETDVDDDDRVSGPADGDASADILGPGSSAADAGVQRPPTGSVARQVAGRPTIGSSGGRSGPRDVPAIDGADRRSNQRSHPRRAWIERQTEVTRKGQKPITLWALMRDGVVEDYLRFSASAQQWVNFSGRPIDPDLDKAKTKQEDL